MDLDFSALPKYPCTPYSCGSRARKRLRCGVELSIVPRIPSRRLAESVTRLPVVVQPMPGNVIHITDIVACFCSSMGNGKYGPIKVQQTQEQYHKESCGRGEMSLQHLSFGLQPVRFFACVCHWVYSGAALERRRQGLLRVRGKPKTQLHEGS